MRSGQPGGVAPRPCAPRCKLARIVSSGPCISMPYVIFRVCKRARKFCKLGSAPERCAVELICTWLRGAAPTFSPPVPTHCALLSHRPRRRPVARPHSATPTPGPDRPAAAPAAAHALRLPCNTQTLTQTVTVLESVTGHVKLGSTPSPVPRSMGICGS